MNRCKNCGTEYDVTNTFCKSCGQKLEKEDSIDEKKQKLKDKGVILLIVFLSFVFLCKNCVKYLDFIMLSCYSVYVSILCLKDTEVI